MTESNEPDPESTSETALDGSTTGSDPADAVSADQDPERTEREPDEQHFDPITAHPDVVELGYEQARDELADVVRRLEAGGLSLEDSLALWERGEALATVCERHLSGAQERVDRALSAVREDEPANGQQ